MNLDAVVKELHQIVREKTPKGTSPQLILERLQASFPPLNPREISNEEAKAILLPKHHGFNRPGAFWNSFLAFSISRANVRSVGNTVMYSLANTLFARPSSA